MQNKVYLLDKAIGLSDNERMLVNVEENMLELATIKSYEFAGKKAAYDTVISKETVKNKIANLDFSNVLNDENKNKKKVSALYIQADEDHVSLQDGNIAMPRLITVYEENINGKLIGKRKCSIADEESFTTTFVMGKEDVEIKSNYEVNKYTIEVTSGENGKVSPAGSVSVNYGENQEFKITPNTGYHIEKVEVDGQDKGTNNTYTFTDVKDNHTINAIFAINPYTITESARLNAGDSKTFTMIANTGYGVKDVKVDGTSVGPVASYIFDNVNENHTIDITLDNSGDIEISNNVTIHGEGHTIYLPLHSVSGGTFYFAPSRFLDTDKYKATKTKDADNVDIWVVTEK